MHIAVDCEPGWLYDQEIACALHAMNATENAAEI